MPGESTPPFQTGEGVESGAFLDQLNKLRGEIVRQSGLSVAPPLTLRRGPDGRVIGRERSRPFWAKYTGSGPAFDCVEQVRTGGGAWANGPRSYTGKCYESSGFAIPTPKIILAEQDDAGKVVGRYIRLSGSPSPCPSDWTVTFNVLACGCPLPGATVTYAGPASGSGTTNSAGQLVVTGLPAGTYTWHASRASFTTGGNRTLVVGPSTPCAVSDAQTLILSDLTKWCGADFSTIPTTLTVTLDNCAAWDFNDRGQAYVVGNLAIVGGNVSASWNKPVDLAGHHGHIDIVITVNCGLHGSSGSLNYSTSGGGFSFSAGFTSGTRVNPINFTVTGFPLGAPCSPTATIVG